MPFCYYCKKYKIMMKQVRDKYVHIDVNCCQRCMLDLKLKNITRNIRDG